VITGNNRTFNFLTDKIPGPTFQDQVEGTKRYFRDRKIHVGENHLAPALAGIAAPGCLDEDLSHGAGGNPLEVQSRGGLKRRRLYQF